MNSRAYRAQRMRLTQRRSLLTAARAKAKIELIAAMAPLFRQQAKRIERFLRRGNLRKKLDKVAISEDLLKQYNPDQPRVPAGNSAGGQFAGDNTIDQKVDDMVDKWTRLGVKTRVVYHPKNSHLELDTIIVPKDNRGNGVGSEIMEEITDFADLHGLTMVLTPDTVHGASSVSRLKQFYRRFGFVENKGRRADYSISDGMYRLPARKKVALIKVHELFKAPSAPGTEDDKGWEPWKKALLLALLLGLFKSTEELAIIENAVWTSRGFEALTYHPETLVEDYQRATGHLLSELADDTMRDVEIVIAGWYASSGSLPDLLHLIDRYFNQHRVETIASTEIGNLLAQMVFHQMQSYNIKDWYWDAMGEDPCTRPLIIGNMTWDGCIALHGQLFHRGDPMPPDASHPNCECLPTPKVGRLAKQYNPDQPRAPKGEKNGGQWVGDYDYSNVGVVSTTGYKGGPKTNYWILPNDVVVTGKESDEDHYKIANKLIGPKETTYGAYNELLASGAIRIANGRRDDVIDSARVDKATLHRIQKLVDDGLLVMVSVPNEDSVNWSGYIVNPPSEPQNVMIESTYEELMSADTVHLRGSSNPVLKMLGIEKGLNPGQARVPAGDRRGGQFADQGKGTSRKKTSEGPREFMSKYVSEENIDQVFQYVADARQYGLESGKENLIAFRDDAVRTSRSFGESNYVMIPDQSMENSTGTVHNHPSSSSFSLVDIDLFLKWENQKIMLVVGHNGNMYVMKKPANHALPIWGGEEYAEPANLQEFWNNSVVDTHKDYQANFSRIGDAEIAGNITTAEVLMPMIAEKNGFEYDYYFTDEYKKKAGLK